MPGKIVDISCAAGYVDTIISSAQQLNATVLSVAGIGENPVRTNIRVFVPNEATQAFLDQLQTLLPAESDPLILLQPVDVRLPAPRKDVEAEADDIAATREELFVAVSKGAQLDRNFIILTILATVVATIGLNEDNVAVVIGAMVIAPLLGPNLGLSLGAALGDTDLMKSALITNLVGVLLTVGLALVIGLMWPPNMHSDELMSRTDVRLSSITLALASGIAAVQSLTTRLASLLVGVMIAVALVPPAAVLGMMIGGAHWVLAAGAATLLAANVICVNLAAEVVFYLRGIRPRTWLEQRAASQSRRVNLIVWIGLLSLIVVLILITGKTSLAELAVN